MKKYFILVFFSLTGCANWSVGFSVGDPFEDPYGRDVPKQCSLDTVANAEATCAIFVKVTRKNLSLTK